ncbi:MAG: Nif3-like dinuclear metal center hexameric protein [Imperialibacter sp.]|uniref:Nif3-like dinuclear metal center hexameric protein n=1 Tax=Imperialibacter sp. TaxID=2038411 RepID=UPI0032EEF875
MSKEEITIKEITSYLETLAPGAYQESYDNAGLIVGNSSNRVTGVLISLDATEEIVDEAIATGCNLIVAHHPIVFKGLKTLTGSNYVERTVIKAIQHDVAIYAIHTNLDNVLDGVNAEIANIIGLENLRILAPKSGILSKIVTFCPKDNTEEVLAALHEAGAGQIGNYDHCSFRVAGTGSFQPNDRAVPHIGTAHQLELVHEDRLELIFPSYLSQVIISTLQTAHPYEEVAYYLSSLQNQNQEVGSGMIGTLPEPTEPEDFLGHLKQKFDLQVIKYTPVAKKIHTVAVCGGAGSFLLESAKKQSADAFVTSDFKYHEYFDAEGKVLVADIGHYESEVSTKNLLHRKLKQKFTNIALRLSKANTNPVRYYL